MLNLNQKVDTCDTVETQYSACKSNKIFLMYMYDFFDEYL